MKRIKVADMLRRYKELTSKSEEALDNDDFEALTSSSNEMERLGNQIGSM
jgi:hypothetical protein